MSDHDPERLLKAGLKDTTPEFERRWTDLKRELRNTPQGDARLFSNQWAWWALPSLISTGLLGFIIYINMGKPHSLPPNQIADFVQLLELEGKLREALPLTDPDLTDTILLIPLPKEEHS